MSDNIELPEQVLEALSDIYDLYKDNDWLVVKRLLINSIHPDYRRMLSLRHYYSKKQVMNDFDKKIISYYENTYGIKLELNNERKHTQDDDPQWMRKDSRSKKNK